MWNFGPEIVALRCNEDLVQIAVSSQPAEQRLPVSEFVSGDLFGKAPPRPPGSSTVSIYQFSCLRMRVLISVSPAQLRSAIPRSRSRDAAPMVRCRFSICAIIFSSHAGTLQCLSPSVIDGASPSG